MPTVDLTQLTSDIKVRPDSECPSIKSINLAVKLQGKPRPIAEISGYLINRSQIRKGAFYSSLEGTSHELWQFAKALWDQDAKLKPELVEHEFHSRSGCWGRELNEGTLLFIEVVAVEEEFLRSGVGSFALNQLLTELTFSYAFAWPEPLLHSPSEDSLEDRRAYTLAFFHKNHFRRVGRTVFLAFSPNDNHPSRKIAANEDIPDNADRFPRLHANELTETDPAKFELHDLILHDFGRGVSIGAIEACIQKVRKTDPEMIHRVNANGFTPLHLAAFTLGGQTARLLLDPELGAIGASTETPDLFRRDNTEGSIPLEVCEQRMEGVKQWLGATIGLSEWDGYPVNGLECAYELRKAMGEDVGSLRDYIVLKNGFFKPVTAETREDCRNPGGFIAGTWALLKLFEMKMDNKIRSDLVINVARDQSILCDEFFDELMEELNENGDKDTVKYFGMPKCPNDLEFNLVRQKLGVPRLSPSYSDDDMDEDSDPADDDDI